jgi:hypothetical protein
MYTIVNHHPKTSLTHLTCVSCATDLVKVPFVLFVVNGHRGHS